MSETITAPVETPTAPASPVIPAAPPAAPVQTTLPSGEMVARIPLKVEEYQSLLARATEYDKVQAQVAEKARAAQEAELAAAAARGEAEKAINLIRRQADESLTTTQKQFEAKQAELAQQLAAIREESGREKAAAENRLREIEARAQKYALDGELSRALAGHNLVPGGADQLAHLWRGQFQVQPDGESFSVRTPTGQTVAQFVGQQLARDDYAHFVRAGNTQGGTHGGVTSAATSPQPPEPQPPAQPKTLGEAVILHMTSQAKAANVDPRTNMGAGFGLKAAR